MITDQELSAAIVSVEQSIRDSEQEKSRTKHDTAHISELTTRILADKARLQLLHYAQGATGRLSQQQLRADIAGIEQHIQTLHEPRETDLFKASDAGKDEREAERQLTLARTKLATLRFVIGEEKKLL